MKEDDIDQDCFQKPGNGEQKNYWYTAVSDIGGFTTGTLKWEWEGELSIHERSAWLW